MSRLKVFLQCLLGLAPFISSFIIPIELLWELSSLLLDRDLSGFRKTLHDIGLNGKIISIMLGLFLTCIIFLSFRLRNKEKFFNTGSDYFDYHWAYFVIASRILGYKKVTLVRVPLYLQFKLLFKDIFDLTYSDTHPEENDIPRVDTSHTEIASNEINLVLSDTYKINLDDLPFEKKGLPTVLIERTNGLSGVRTYNQKFVDVIREQTNKYRLQYERVNIFATTNTQHTKEMVLQCFKNGGRTGFKKIYVYEQGSDYKFKKPHQIQ